jgi:two-component system, OmpR family, sensor kinase
VSFTSLRTRVTTWYVGLLAAALLVFGAALYFSAQDYLVSTLQNSLQAEAEGISANFLSSEEIKGTQWMSGEIVEAYAPEQSGRFIRITRQDGAVLYQSGATREAYIGPADVPRPNPADFKRSFREEKGRESHRLMVYSEPYTSASGAQYLVETGASLAPVERVLNTLLRTLCLITPLILLAAAFGGHFLMQRPLRPLTALANHAERIGTNTLGERLPVIASGDEMERMSHSLNRMITRLEDALNHDRRFSADVSHELRTPLTILRGELEQLSQTPGLSEPMRDTLASALEEIVRMAKIVENLLAIARVDSGTEVMDRQCVDLSAIAEWIADQMHLLAAEKHISLRCITPGPVQIVADPARIKQVLVNLLDNSIKYTPEGGSIAIAVRVVQDKALLEVQDTGIGVPEASLPHVFKRFFRSDEARSRESGGTGLGLSIVQAICHAHGGSVNIESSEGFGTTVRVGLPLLNSV